MIINDQSRNLAARNPNLTSQSGSVDEVSKQVTIAAQPQPQPSFFLHPSILNVRLDLNPTPEVNSIPTHPHLGEPSTRNRRSPEEQEGQRSRKGKKGRRTRKNRNHARRASREG